MYRVLAATAAVVFALTPAHAQNMSQGKDFLEGGPRPQISPKAPPKITFRSSYRPGTILIDTKRRRLVFTLADGKAYLYPITVGRLGFQWTGTHRISAKRSWPDWRPPAAMRKRQPELPRVMSGGIHNPLGAKALYIGSTLYRIHGTNNAGSIGAAASSGCIRMHNAHVTHLASLAQVGAQVIVRSELPRQLAQNFVPTAVPDARPAMRTVQRQSRPAHGNTAWRRSVLGYIN